jgi:hypothetical protein
MPIWCRWRVEGTMTTMAGAKREGTDTDSVRVR